MRGRIVSSPSSAVSPPAEQLYLYYPSRRLQPAGFQALWMRSRPLSTDGFLKKKATSA